MCLMINYMHRAAIIFYCVIILEANRLLDATTYTHCCTHTHATQDYHCISTNSTEEHFTTLELYLLHFKNGKKKIKHPLKMP